MPATSATTYLDLGVGVFRLALRADCVVGVQRDIEPTQNVEFRGQKYAFADLRALFANGGEEPAPYGVAFEVDGSVAMIGVESVDHWRPGESASLRPLPGFGLGNLQLFEGALRDDRGLLLVLRPAFLAQLTTANQRDI